MGYLFAFIAVFLWSFNYIIAVTFTQSLTPFEIALGRWLVASVVLLPLTVKEIKNSAKKLWQNKILIICLAVTGMVLCNTLIYYAGQTANPLNMSLLGLTGPVFIVLLSVIFLKYKINFVQVLGFAVAIIGVMFIIFKGNLNFNGVQLVSGDWWMLCNAFSFAIYTLLQMHSPKDVSQQVLLTVTAIIGTAIIFPLAYFENGGIPFEELSLKDVEIFLYLGILNSVVAYLAWNSAIAKIGSVQTGIVYYTLPLFSGIEAYFFVGEEVSLPQVYGGISVVLGIVLVSFDKKKCLKLDNKSSTH